MGANMHKESNLQPELLSPEDLKHWRRINDDHYEELLRLGLPVVHTPQGIQHSKSEVYDWYFAVPPGSPAWVTPKEIEDTLRVWQPYYQQLLTAIDALEMLINVRNLLDVMYPENRQ
jgi:hypothetical protein